MSATNRLKQGKIDTKGDLATIGSATLITGITCSGCAAITVVGIPALIVTLPISLIGLIMLLITPFLKTKDVKCPKCGELNHVLTNRKAFACKECDTTVIVSPEGKATL